MTRREAMRRAGSAAIGLAAALPDGTDLIAAVASAGAQSGDRQQFPRGAIIRTIVKDVPPSSIGAVLFHEHLQQSATFGVQGGPGVAQPTTHFTEDFATMVEELKLAMQDGATLLVEAGHADQGRRPSYVRQLSIASGMPVVLSGGYHSAASYPPEVFHISEDDLVEELVRSSVAERWGAFGEIGMWREAITPEEKKMARAVSKAHVRTGLPIFTHTDGGKNALPQLEIYLDMGVDPRHLTIGHMADLGDDPKAPVHKAIAKRGVYLGFDRVGRNPKLDENAVPVVRALIDAGFADTLLFGSDGGAFPDILKSKGGAGFARSRTVFLPKLRAAGVDEETIRRITVDNPRRFLAIVPKKVTL